MKILIGTREYDMPDVPTPAPSTLSSQPSTVSKTRAEAVTALQQLEPFMGRVQRQCVVAAFRGEERQYFYDLMCSLAERVRTMPVTYEQDGAGEDAIAHLHYFAGGQASWWITEKDKSGGDQNQAFGLADLFRDGGELGYISIAEILQCGGELDFHFTPKTLREIRAE